MNMPTKHDKNNHKLKTKLAREWKQA